MVKRRLGHLDLDTGEVLEHLNLYAVTPKRRNGFGKRWFAMSMDAGKMLAGMRKELGSDGYAVLHYLTSVLDYENEVFISKTEIANDMGLLRPNLARAFKKLLNHKIIIEGRKVGNMRAYHLNPEIAWRGDGRNHVITLDKYRKDKLDS